METQYSLFEDIKLGLKPGDWVEAHGRELSFDEIARKAGGLVVMDHSTSSRSWYKVVRVERIVTTDDGRRLVYFDGTKQNGIVNERFFPSGGYTGSYPARAYEV